MNLKDILLELVSNVNVKVELDNKIIDIPVEMYDKILECKIKDYQKNAFYGKTKIILYLDAEDYNKIKNNDYNLSPILDYNFGF